MDGKSVILKKCLRLSMRTEVDDLDRIGNKKVVVAPKKSAPEY